MASNAWLNGEVPWFGHPKGVERNQAPMLGGHYGYRMAKAALNMLCTTMVRLATEPFEADVECT